MLSRRKWWWVVVKWWNGALIACWRGCSPGVVGDGMVAFARLLGQWPLLPPVELLKQSTFCTVKCCMRYLGLD